MRTVAMLTPVLALTLMPSQAWGHSWCEGNILAHFPPALDTYVKKPCPEDQIFAPEDLDRGCHEKQDDHSPHTCTPFQSIWQSFKVVYHPRNDGYCVKDI